MTTDNFAREADEGRAASVSGGSPRWRRALVTGGTSGIGAALVGLLANQGTDLIVVGRDKAAMARVRERTDPKVAFEPVLADLADEASIAEIEARLLDADQPIDLLVNCAGYTINGPFLDQSIADMVALMNVNATTLMRLCFSAASQMREAGGGDILNISSKAAFRATPGVAVYSAAKSFVNVFSRTLALEMAPHGVRVACVCPGVTETQFLPRAGLDVAKMSRVGWQQPNEVAAVALAAMRAGDIMTLTSQGNAGDIATSLTAEWNSVVVRDPLEPEAIALPPLLKEGACG
jgi:short-subunit dehydrogenase